MKTVNFKRSALAMAVVASLSMVSASALAADSGSSGFLTGNATTVEGQKLDNVKITITNQNTGLTRTVTTTESGSFRFPLLPTGVYNFKAEKDGYLVAQQKDVRVTIGDKTFFDVSLSTKEQDMETISVMGSRISRIDTTSSEAVTIIDQELLARVPIARDITSVALLAPGTTQGDAGFGNLASFGGSSVGENSFYVNGMNVTNFRNGLGGSDVPFEFYETFEVKTGGYSAEFGRSTGGVVNATTKRGSNEFSFGASAYFEPESMRASTPQVYRTQEGTDLYGTKFYNGDQSQAVVGESNYNLWASGAIVEDKLFYYGLVNYQERQSDFASTSNQYEREAGDIFYAIKLDYYITPDHILELTAFDSSSDLDSSKYNWDPDTKTQTDYRGDYTLKRGGQTYSLKYTGILSDNFTMSAMAGRNEANYSNINAGDSPFGTYPAVYERFSGTDLGEWALYSPSVEEDTRDAYRLDFDWYLTDNHTLRFGVDYEEMSAKNETRRAGGAAYRYQDCTDMDAVKAGDPSTCATARKEIYENVGDFETKSYAYYLTDTWQATDDLTLSLGIRNEAFENYNKAGEKFVDISNQWAPRLGAAWDVMGDGESKVFANYGRYFLPVATNTNVRLAGDELYTRQYFDVLGIKDDISKEPILGDAQGPATVYADGTLKDTAETVNANVDPMYQDEFILGFQTLVTEDWSVGVKGTYRDLKSSLEDVAIDKGFEDYLQREFGSGCTVCDGFHYYVLTNPGSDVTITTDPDGDGPLDKQAYTIPAADLGYPEAERTYYAVDLNVNKAWDDGWMLDFTYTWSKSEGNNEGFVRSDNEQTDSGLTTNFDQPGLTDGAYGYLPNDRRHQIKFFAAYEIMENFTAGANFWWRTGRPINAFGFHPTDVYASWYEAESFAKDGEIVPRGTMGRTPDSWNLDLSLQYLLELESADITFRADVFNVFNNDEISEVNETAEIYDGYDADRDYIYLGAPNPDYQLPTNFQSPRYVRLSASVKF